MRGQQTLLQVRQKVLDRASDRGWSARPCASSAVYSGLAHTPDTWTRGSQSHHEFSFPILSRHGSGIPHELVSVYTFSRRFSKHSQTLPPSTCHYKSLYNSRQVTCSQGTNRNPTYTGPILRNLLMLAYFQLPASDPRNPHTQAIYQV